MNNPEVTMHVFRSCKGFQAHQKAVEAAGIAIRLALKVPASLRSRGDQVIRSASWVAANLAEGHGRTGKDRMYHFRIALGSAKEADTHLRVRVRTRCHVPFSAAAAPKPTTARVECGSEGGVP